MGILKRLFSCGPDYSDPHELKAIWDKYSDQWPDNNDQYRPLKPESILPAPKWVVKRAIKLAYAEWPVPIDETVFSAFGREFMDLALHLPQEEFDAIERFGKGRIKCRGREMKSNPLSDFRALLIPLPGSLCYGPDWAKKTIIQVRDGFRRSKVWDPVDADDDELDAVRRILLNSATEYFTLEEEWGLYILSIGRDRYVENS